MNIFRSLAKSVVKRRIEVKPTCSLITNFDDEMKKYILSIDGGGIKGLIPAIILSEIERIKQKPISKMFDLMAGTSTGGMIVTALALSDNYGRPQYSSKDLINFYKESGPYIFKRSKIRKVRSLVLGSRYRSKPLEKSFHKYFKDAILAEASTKILIPSYDVRNNIPVFFKSWKNDINFIRIKDALRAATAAPTYFSPKILEIRGQKCVLVDGGLYANNPATCAYACAKNLFPNDDFVIISLGTGRKHLGLNPASSQKMGRIRWALSLVKLVFAADMMEVDYHMSTLLKADYIRLNLGLTKASEEMDNVSSANLNNLELEAQIILKEQRGAIEKICGLLP